MHVFKCIAESCRGKGRDRRLINRYLNTKDAKSTGNLHKHEKLCWSEATIIVADDATKSLDTAQDVLKKLGVGNTKLMAMFERCMGGKVTYLHTQHTKTETK